MFLQVQAKNTRSESIYNLDRNTSNNPIKTILSLLTALCYNLNSETNKTPLAYLKFDLHIKTDEYEFFSNLGSGISADDHGFYLV